MRKSRIPLPNPATTTDARQRLKCNLPCRIGRDGILSFSTRSLYEIIGPMKVFENFTMPDNPIIHVDVVR